MLMGIDYNIEVLYKLLKNECLNDETQRALYGAVAYAERIRDLEEVSHNMPMTFKKATDEDGIEYETPMVALYDVLAYLQRGES